MVKESFAALVLFVVGCTHTGPARTNDAGSTVASGAFDGGDGSSPPIEQQPAPGSKGVGSLIYWTSDLRAFASEEEPTFAAVTVGLVNVELLRVQQDGRVNAVTLEPPEVACDRGPVAIVVGDYTGDGEEDVLVEDPCGNWLAEATTTGFEAHVSSERLPDPGPQHHAEYLQLADASVWFAGGTVASVFGIRWEGGHWEPAQWFNPPSPLTVQVTRLIVPWHVQGAREPQVVVQGYGEMYRVTLGDIGDAAGAPNAEVLSQVITPPFVAPLAGFDHLTPLWPQCPNRALGVGVVGRTAGALPRRLELLTFVDRQFELTEFPLSGLEVVTFATLWDEANLRTVVGILGRQMEGWVFALAQVTDCDGLQELARTPLEFAYRTAPLPDALGGGTLTKTNGLKLLAFNTQDKFSFMHYDGYSLRVVTATQADERWALDPMTIVVHDVRRDRAIKGG